MVLGAATDDFLGAGEVDDGGECLRGTGDVRPPPVRILGGDGDFRPGDIFCRLLEGTGDADLLVAIRLGGMFRYGLLSLCTVTTLSGNHSMIY